MFEQLQLIVTVFGSVITVLLIIIGYFLRQSHLEIKDMLLKHDESIQEHSIDIALLKQKVE